MSSVDKAKDKPQSKDTAAHSGASVAKSKYHCVVTKPVVKKKDKDQVGKFIEAKEKTYLHIRTMYTSGMELVIRGKEPALDHVFEINTKAEPMNMKDLIKYIDETQVVKGNDGAFAIGGTIRPGILVLINESDWEVMDDLEYELQDNDIVEFISTLHGG
ncbi:Ubiquitin- modifier 1 [Coemansia sp. 'formosensis']|nr:Ubiquitin- modifier 1 [Coemansia sp. 'formosensis']